MGVIGDLAINVLAGAIFFALGWAVSRAQSRWRYRRIRAFWRRLASPDLKIVTTIFMERGLYVWERSRLLGVGDMLAVAEVQRHLRELGRQYLHPTTSDQLSGVDRKSDLILIGGTHANTVTAEVMERLPLTFTFGESEAHDYAVHDQVTGQAYAVAIDKDDTLTADQGIVVCAPNPFAPERNVLIIAGSFDFGTAAGAQLLSRGELVDHEIVRSGAHFEAYFSVDVVGGAPQHISRLIVRRIAHG